ncbi:MAG: hypothetical protein JWM99_4565 [Verrucomicrobiales bacterium]|nr:hypothetical protein [Verrucomicrobiales bacterium]
MSLTPCFSWVQKARKSENRFNGLSHNLETVKTVPNCSQLINTQLKQGVNERCLPLEAQSEM